MPTPQSQVVVTAALTGVLATRKQCPSIPYTAAEIADEAIRSYEAGATIVHIHAREDDGSACWRPEVFQQIANLIRPRCPVILNFSTGGIGSSIQNRSRHLPLVKPEMAALNMGSMNYSLYSARQKKFIMRGVFLNPFEDIEFLLKLMADNGVIPELECFDAGHICNADPFIDMGLLKPPFHFSLIMGVTGGISATPQNLRNQVGLLPGGANWQLVGISKEQWELVDLSLDLGGHIRVGLEDNFYLPNGEMAKSNAELVEMAVKRVLGRGQKVATIEETRKMLKG
ncbi:3-keto-5-aminohexanoate cleavage protein [Bdellovibrionota bacterium FG-1]